MRPSLLLRTSKLLALLGWLVVPAVAPGAVSAQAPGAAPSRDAGVTMGVETRLTSVRSQGAWMLGGRLRFHLAEPASFGAEAWTLVDEVAVGAGDPGGGIRLTLSYAGLVGNVVLLRRGPVQLGVGLLAGAGNSKVRFPVSGAEIAADNFVVTEPSADAALRMAGPLHLRGAVSYRWTAGVEDLTRIGGDQLQGASLTLGLSLGPF